MRPIKLIWGIGGTLLVALLIGCYFYQRSNEMMRVESKNLFIQALKGEMLRMERELDLSCVSMNVSGATAPWTRLSVKTEFGTKDYVVDVKKDLKNISSDFNERSLHSVVCMEKQLSADTLNRIWADSLRMRHIVAKTSVQVVSADSSKCIRSEGSCDNNCFVSPIWIAYVGNECEVEVAGFLSSTCWSVIRYSSSSFVLIVGVTFILFAFFYYVYKVKKHLSDSEVEEELLKERLEKERERYQDLEEKRRQYEQQLNLLQQEEKMRIRELSDLREKHKQKEAQIEVLSVEKKRSKEQQSILEKECQEGMLQITMLSDKLEKEKIDRGELQQKLAACELQIAELRKIKEMLGEELVIYKLCSGLTFDPRNHILDCAGNRIKLDAQGSRLLLLFLEASENKLSYEELLEMMWADRRKDKNRLWTAVSRLRKALAPTRVIIKVKNEGGYQLVLPKESDDFSQRELF